MHDDYDDGVNGDSITWYMMLSQNIYCDTGKSMWTVCQLDGLIHLTTSLFYILLVAL